MRPARTAVLGLLVALAATAAPAAAVATPSGDLLRGPAASADPGADEARAALEAVADAFAGQPASARRRSADASQGRQLTLLLRDLRLGLDELEGADRRRAEGYLARPDGDPAFSGEPLYDAGVVTKNDCTVAPTEGSRVCVHWATTSADAPPLLDTDEDGVPDQVETTRDVLNEVWTRIVGQGGYRAPRSDLASENHGPDGRLDVYLADLGASGLYGYCTTDDPTLASSFAVSAFCAVDDDFSERQFFGDPVDNLKVTAAHEFFHAVQYAYDWLEDGWLLEGTAAWVEDELYDDVNDNLQYLDGSPLTDPEVPMDYAGGDYNIYGNWIFWRYLAERFPAERGTGMPVVVRDVVTRLGGAATTSPGEYSTQALVRTLAARDVAFPPLFSQFGTANRRPAAYYEEGRSYPAARPALSLTLKNSKAKGVTARPYHLSNQTFRVVPAKALKGNRWKLRVSVDMPKRSFGYAAAVTTLSRTGAVRTKQVRLTAGGDGKLVTSFGRKKVRWVEVTLTNASVRYRCWEDRVFACQGTPKDDGRRVKATVKAYR